MNDENVEPVKPVKKAKKRTPSIKAKFKSIGYKLERIDILAKEIREAVTDLEFGYEKIEAFKKSIKDM